MKQRLLLASLVAALALNSLIKSPDANGGPRGPAQEHQLSRAPEQTAPSAELPSQSVPNAGDPNMQ